jgi:hypothetical protein
MIKLITWEMDGSKAPTDPKERRKLTMAHCELVQEGIDSGQTKMWGINPGGNHGFCITDADEKAIFAMIVQYIPHVKFKVDSMRSIDEVIATLKAMQKQG